MKQVLQNLSNGDTQVIEAPLPSCGSSHVRIRSAASLISLGTERMLVDFGRANLLQKARQQPEKVKMVLDKVSTDGIATTYDAVKSKLDQPIPLGYCLSGIVESPGNSGLKVGDRVTCNGNHAEVVCVPKNLVAKIPDNVTFEQATFTPVIAIGLQGIRLAQPQIGDTVVVMGLGLIGLLTVQTLVAQGCTVIGTDYDSEKLALAESYGAKTIDLKSHSNPVSEAISINQGRLIDSVLITASTKSDDPVSHAANMLRQRGKIILVGVVGLKLNRSDLYEKEITFQVSCSYGPGRYDPFYEEQGNDYPIGFVRWTEQRNFEAALGLLENGRIDVNNLITERYAISDAANAYERVSNDKKSLGLLLEYPYETSNELTLATKIPLKSTRANPINQLSKTPTCAVIGAGNYASRVLIPAIKKNQVNLKTLISHGGLTAAHNGTEHGFEYASTKIEDAFDDPDINTVIIATRHDSHASLVTKGLATGKHIFVEKPLALNKAEIDAIEKSYNEIETEKKPVLMVGYNRRFSPLVVKMKELINTVTAPKCFIMTMNAGFIPADSWVHSKELGGGRIIGEACHYIDLMRHLTGAEIVSINAFCVGDNPSMPIRDDNASITIGFSDGSLGTIHYFANGGKVFPKERIEVFAGDSVLQLDNFRSLKGFGWPKFKSMKLVRQNKGQLDCTQAFFDSITNGPHPPIPFDEIIEVGRATIDAAEQLSRQ